VICDGPATVFAAVDLLPGPAERLIDPKRHPGSHGFSERRELEGEGPETFRVRLAAYARRAVKKAGGSKVLFNLGIRRADGLFHNNPNPGGRARSKLTTR
jgi:hypothetical protein